MKNSEPSFIHLDPRTENLTKKYFSQRGAKRERGGGSFLSPKIFLCRKKNSNFMTKPPLI
jgi:hypothetical protein